MELAVNVKESWRANDMWKFEFFDKLCWNSQGDQAGFFFGIETTVSEGYTVFKSVWVQQK